jgi:hypothetical protein
LISGFEKEDGVRLVQFGACRLFTRLIIAHNPGL